MTLLTSVNVKQNYNHNIKIKIQHRKQLILRNKNFLNLHFYDKNVHSLNHCLTRHLEVNY